VILLHRLHAHNFKHLRDVTLYFPESGTLLIEGENEAGKSSLFEAVFFALYGKNLIPDQDYRLIDLKNYGAEQLCVELDFSIEGKRFHVERRIGQNQTASLICPAGEGEIETLRKLKEIEARVGEELRLSPNALLNTCFVEQKKLEQLESLNLADRTRTINELLNLKVFTVMEGEFRETLEDRQQRKQAEERMKAAGLDAELPVLQAAESQAARRRSYAELLGVANGLRRRSAEIAAVQAKLSDVQRRRQEIAGEIERHTSLSARRNALETHLTLLARAWNAALDQWAAASERVRNLETLTAELPNRRVRLQRFEGLRERLIYLESLEKEETNLIQRSEALAEERRRRDALQAEWQSGEKDRERQSTEVKTRSDELAAAQSDVEQRGLARRTFESLLAFQERLSDLAQKETGARLQEDRLQAAQEQASRLSSLQQRLNILLELERRFHQRNRDRESLARKREDLKRVEERQAEYAQHVTEIARIEGELDRHDRESQILRDRESAASERFRQAQAADTLNDWAEVTERLREVETAEARQAEIRRRRAAEEVHFQAAETSGQRAARQRTLFAGLAVLGLLGGIAGIAAGIVALLPVGLALILFGGFAASRSHMAYSTARSQAVRFRSSADALSGEERALQSTLQENADSARWEQRQAELENALKDCDRAVPATPEEARKLAAQRPEEASGRLESEWRTVWEALGKAENAAHLLREQGNREREAVASVDRKTLERESQDLRSEVEALEVALQATDDLPGRFREEKLAEDGTDLFDRLEAARREGAAADAAEKSLPDLGQEARNRAEGVREVAHRIEILSAELGLMGMAPSDWEAATESGMRAFEEAERALPDMALQEQVERSIERLNAVRDRLSRLEEAQERRQAELDARPLAALDDDRKTLLADQEKNKEARGSMADLRPALSAEGLPVESGTLSAHLSVLTSELERDRREADTLSAQRAVAENAHDDAKRKRDDLVSAWERTLHGESVPPDPKAALVRLPELQSDLTRELETIDLDALNAEDCRADQQERQWIGDFAACQSQIEDLESRRDGLLNAFAPDTEDSEAGLTPPLAIEDLPSRFPELERVGPDDLSHWEAELARSRDAIGSNRAKRDLYSVMPHIGDALLDFEVERNAYEDEERRLRTKRRAGEILQKTRQTLVGRVMPMTLQYMRMLLPALTDGRYRDVEWDEAANQLSVHDSRAGRAVRKRVFSGGARDQISLALRLAFALATLPGEHHVRPGWLFLDEPLSSFDRNRTQALVDLLTRGILREQFRQIFLISHSESFDPDQFDYRIRMADGRIVESTLPSTDLVNSASSKVHAA
jgi:DNA repair exonuclease SbcCD ATPase subunit